MINLIKTLARMVIAVMFIVIITVFNTTAQQTNQTIPETRLRSFFLNYIESRAGGGDIQLSRFKVRGETEFVPGEVELKVQDTTKGTISKRVNITVGVWVNGKKEGRVFLSGWVDRYERVVCAARRISRGVILTENDINFQKINVSKTPANLVMNINDAVGKRLKTSLKAGSYMRSNMIEDPPLIQKGDKVSLVAKKGRVVVITSGIAESNGVKDEQIKVKNADSERIVIGRVINGRRVDVVF